MLDQIKDPPWEHDNKVVLEEKWRAANARADKCESLKGELDWIHRMPRSREAKLNSIEKTAASVAEVATIAIRGLYPRDLLSEDFQWFVEQQTHKLPEILNQIQEEICSVPNCPEFLFKEHTKDSKALITLIQSKRWEKLLPLFRKQADYLVLFACGFADTLQQTLNERSTTPTSESPAEHTCEEYPESPADWEQLAKKPILFNKQEIILTPQSRLLLLKLLSSRNNWVSAGDLDIVLPEKRTIKKHTESKVNTAIQPNTSTKSNSMKIDATISKRITQGINKLETQLMKQFQIERQKGKQNREDRPIQRRVGRYQTTEYRLNPDFSKKLSR
jgi:hypothetical protein